MLAWSLQGRVFRVETDDADGDYAFLKSLSTKQLRNLLRCAEEDLQCLRSHPPEDYLENWIGDIKFLLEEE